MKIGIIKPFLRGHETRGTGVYTDNLINSFKSYPGIELKTGNYKHLPEDTDLFHFTYFDPFFLTMPWFKNKPTVITVHDMIPLRFPRYFPAGIKGKIKLSIQKFLVQRANAIITDSYASKSDIIKFLNIQETKIYPVYLAPADDYFNKISHQNKEKIRNKYHLPELFLLFVGDANWNKNLPKVITASKELKLPLVIVSKSLKEFNQKTHNIWTEFLSVSKKMIEDNNLVTVLGDVELTDLVGIYQMARVLIYPSFYEGFGLPVVEAFASQCPVITTDRGSLQEITGDAALIVNPDNQQEINAAVLKILKDKSFRDKLVTSSFQTVRKYSWHKTASQTIKVYQLVLNSKK